MPRFHLNIYNDEDSLDVEGLELPDLAAAEREAVKGVRDLIADGIRSGRVIHRSHRVEITDDDGRVLGAVRFEDELRIEA